MAQERVVIVGAGFGGMKLAKLMAKEDVKVTIIDRRNFTLFQPLLYQVSTSVLSTDEVAYPIRASFRKNPNVELFMARAEGVDQQKQVVHTNHGDIPYDYLVLAAGATTNFFGMANVEQHAYGMKTLQEALHIRNHVLHMFERAEKHEDDEAMRRKMLAFVIVGGGPTGIEEAGAIMELVNIQKKEFHNLNFDEVTVRLIEATEHVLPMMAQNLQEHAIKVLQKKGVKVQLATQVVDYDGEELKLKDGSVIPTRTVIWAAGVKAMNFIKDCGGEVDRAGRIIVEEDLRAKGSDCVFAIGDCASFCHGTERPLPTVAPVATQEAVTVHKNIMKLIRGEKDLESFHYIDRGSMATIGRGEAVVNKTKMNPQMTGFLAWCAWMFVHLARLTSTHTKITVGIKWAWNLFSGVRLGRIITNIKLTD